MHIQGSCETDGQLLIEGRISGNVTAHGVELAASGSVDGNVIAAENAKSTPGFHYLRPGHRCRPRGSGRRYDWAAKCTVESSRDEAVIHGQVHGGILARNRLALEETAEVEGDVHARRLALKEGGQVNGNISMGERADLEPSRTEPAHVADPVAAEDEVLVSAAHSR